MDGSAPKKFAATRFSKTSIVPEVNDKVLAYHGKYLYQGTYMKDCTIQENQENGKKILWDDGFDSCEAGTKLHKLVRLTAESSLEDEDAEKTV